MVGLSDLKVIKSVGGALGGVISTSVVPSAVPNNLFTNVDNSERVAGEDFYKCVYWKNGHATESMDNFSLWLSTKSFPNDTVIKWGFDPSSTAQTIPDKYTAPTGITWIPIGTQPSTPNHGDLAAGASFPIWVWYHVNPNAQSRLDDSEIFSFSFDIPQGGTAPPPPPDGGGGGGTPPPTSTDYKIALAGDWGCENETDDVISLINSGGYNVLVGVGDNAYASSSCWTSRFSSLKSSGKFQHSAYGNHEYSESGGISPYKTFFGESLTYSTFKFQNIFFMIIDSNINMDVGSAQHTAIKNALLASQTDNTITWRVGIIHHPWFGASSDHTYNAGGAVQAFHQLFQDNKVQLVVSGHNHNWQRTKKVLYNSGSPTNPTVVSESSPYSTATKGIIHVVSGTGGHDSGSSLYSLGSQPSFQQYQNRTHNGIWEIVASNNAQTLTCSFVDTNGTKYDTFVIQTSSVVVTGSVDKYGIKKLNATKTGGREWFNTWDNAHARTITSANISIRNEDPYDIYSDFHCNQTDDTNGHTATINGTGILTMEGSTPRMYVNDKNRVLKWENVEMTIYYRYLDDSPTGSIHVHARLAGRTEHQDEYLCAASGHTAAAFESKADGTLQLRKELVHPAYADNEVSGTSGGWINQWIGMKLVLRNEGGDVRSRGYIDLTDGASGGTWTEVVSKLDSADWAFTDPTEIATYDAANDGSGTCNKITPRTARIVGPANSCYLRCDGSIVEFKKFSIREISAL